MLNPPISEAKMVEAAKGQDLKDLLNHIAWTDVLEPELLKIKMTLATRLTAAVLKNNSQESLGPEQLAGMSYGIDVLLATIRNILRKGESAEASFRSAGFNLLP